MEKAGPVDGPLQSGVCDIGERSGAVKKTPASIKPDQEQTMQDMESKDYLSFICEEIHTVVAATVDDEGLPVTAAIDMMDSDEGGLYFLTAKGKSFYDRLIKRGYMALTAVRGEKTMDSAAVSVRGRVRELGPALLPRLFEKNPYMREIYPTEASRAALTVFKLYEGTGEWFDLSRSPIFREVFSFGGAVPLPEGYVITEDCIGCGVCVDVCPQKCIDISARPLKILPEHCLRCGNCWRECPADAVIKTADGDTSA